MDAAEEGPDAVDDDGAGLDRLHPATLVAPPRLPRPAVLNILAACRCPASARATSPTAGRGSWPSGAGAPGWPRTSAGSRSVIPTWQRPSRRRVLAIRDRLREMYGRPVNQPHGHPIAELVRTVLSQNTNDRNRDVAYGRHARPLPDLGAGARRSARRARGGAAPGGPGAVEDSADPGDPAGELGDPPDLDWLADAPARAGARLPDRPARRRPQDGGLRPDLHLRPARDPGRHPRPPRRRSAGPVPRREPRSTRPTTRCSRSRRPRTPTSSTST